LIGVWAIAPDVDVMLAIATMLLVSALISSPIAALLQSAFPISNPACPGARPAFFDWIAA
jgi:hypothetical protein